MENSWLVRKLVESGLINEGQRPLNATWASIISESDCFLLGINPNLNNVPYYCSIYSRVDFMGPIAYSDFGIIYDISIDGQGRLSYVGCGQIEEDHRVITEFDDHKFFYLPAPNCIDLLSKLPAYE